MVDVVGGPAFRVRMSVRVPELVADQLCVQPIAADHIRNQRQRLVRRRRLAKQLEGCRSAVLSCAIWSSCRL